MNFSEYLASKKIDATAFEGRDPELYRQWMGQFEQMHPSSFTSRHLFQINRIRRKFTLSVLQAPVTTSPSKKPVIKPKMN
jgi:hypothetical protein